jgi:hypothetical protein
MRALIAAAVVAGSIIVGAAAPALADDGIGVGGGGAEDPWAEVGVPGAELPGNPSGGSGRVRCVLYDVPGIETPYDVTRVPVRDPVPGRTYVLTCTNARGEEVYNELIVYEPGVTVIDAAGLARHAYRDLPLLFPAAHLSPPADADQLVGVPTWLWVDARSWVATSATASVPGLSATVTATPVRLVWRPGDGAEVVCEGPGRAYDPARRAREQRTECSHTYQRSSHRQPGGRYRAEVQMVWRVTWHGSNGRRGTLPDVWRGVRFGVRAVERQATTF